MMRTLARITLLAALAVTVSGCASMFRSETATQSRLAQKPDPEPKLTTAQRRQGFARFYSEGIRLVAENKHGLAVGAFQEATQLVPDSYDAWFNLAACYEMLGDPFRAIKIYRQLLERNPDDADCYANIGTCCIKMYHRERNPTWREMASEAWRHSLDLQPDQPDILGYLASAAETGDS